MHQGVAHSAGGVLIPVVRPDHLAGWKKYDFDQVDEPATNDLYSRTVRPATNERPASPFDERAVVALEPIPVWTAHRQVHQPIWAKRQAVQTAVVLMTEAGEDDGAFVSTPVAVGVLPGDEIGRISDVEFAAAPDQPHRKDQLIDKHTRGFITTIAIAVFKHFDATLPSQRGQFSVEIKARRFRDKQPATLVERGEHGKNSFR